MAIPMAIPAIIGGATAVGSGVAGILGARSQSRAMRREARRAEEAQKALQAQWEAAMAEYRRQAELARRQNVERAQRIIDGYMQARARGMRDVAESGVGERADIRQESRRRGGALGQQMVGRGLAGSTVGSSLQRGVDRERAQALAAQRRGQADRRMSVDQQLTGQLLGMMERIQQPAPQRPDQGAFIAAMQQLGSTAGAARGSAAGMMPTAIADALGALSQMIPVFGQAGVFGGGGAQNVQARSIQAMNQDLMFGGPQGLPLQPDPFSASAGQGFTPTRGVIR